MTLKAKDGAGVVKFGAGEFEIEIGESPVDVEAAAIARFGEARGRKAAASAVKALLGSGHVEVADGETPTSRRVMEVLRGRKGKED